MPWVSVPSATSCGRCGKVHAPFRVVELPTLKHILAVIAPESLMVSKPAAEIVHGWTEMAWSPGSASLARPRTKAEELHQIRLAIKKLRAMLRLVRPAAGKSFCQERDRQLRSAAKLLSVARDASVAPKTLRWAEKKVCRKKHRHTFKIVRQRFHPQVNPMRDYASRRAAAVKVIETTVCETEQALQPWRQGGPGWEVLETSWIRQYRKNQSWMRRAFESGRDKDFHQWRKHVKYFFYQTQLLSAARAGTTAKSMHRLDRLQEQLGRYHDLTVLKDLLLKNPAEYGGKKPVRDVAHQIDQQKKRFRKHCQKLGKKLFSSFPPRFALGARLT